MPLLGQSWCFYKQFGIYIFFFYPICVRKTKNSSLQAFSLLSHLLTFSQCKIDGTTDKDWPVPSGNVILFVDGPMAVSKANIDTVVHPEPFKLPCSNSPNIQWYSIEHHRGKDENKQIFTFGSRTEVGTSDSDDSADKLIHAMVIDWSCQLWFLHTVCHIMKMEVIFCLKRSHVENKVVFQCTVKHCKLTLPLITKLKWSHTVTPSHCSALKEFSQIRFWTLKVLLKYLKN